jgi:hypothetical protein
VLGASPVLFLKQLVVMTRRTPVSELALHIPSMPLLEIKLEKHRKKVFDIILAPGTSHA